MQSFAHDLTGMAPPPPMVTWGRPYAPSMPTAASIPPQMPYPTNGMQSAVNEGRAVIPEGMRVPMPDATERELGRATKFMSKKAWMRSLLGVQMATSAYAGDPGGWKETADRTRKQPEVLNMPPAQLFGTMEAEALQNSADLRWEFKTAQIVHSVQIVNRDTDTEVWLVAYKKPMDHVLHVMLGLRGTSSGKDVISDLKGVKVCIDDPWPLAKDLERWLNEFTITDPRVRPKIRDIAVHMGFWKQYNSLREAVAREVRIAIQKAPGPYDILIAGHSMGGALARLCAYDLLGHGIAIKGRTVLVTIGAGPIGNREFAETIDLMLGADEDLSRNLHIVNRHDPVPATALDTRHGGSLIGCLLCDEGSYVHGGTMVWMDAKGGFFDLNPACYGFYGGSLRLLSRIWAYACCCLPSVDNPVSDHLGTPYVRSFAKCCKTMGVQTPLMCQDPAQIVE